MIMYKLCTIIDVIMACYILVMQWLNELAVSTIQNATRTCLNQPKRLHGVDMVCKDELAVSNIKKCNTNLL